MTDSGYTLVESLVALAILGMAIAGLSAGVQVLARQQSRVHAVIADMQAIRLAQSGFDRIFEGQGPYRSDQPERFVGGPQSLRFDCGQPQACTANLIGATTTSALQLQTAGGVRTLPLHLPSSSHFAYFGTLSPSDVWPPTRPERQVLRSISVVSGEGEQSEAILKTKIWREEAALCQFDVILQDCR